MADRARGPGLGRASAICKNTPILVTRLTDADGASCDIFDFCPRFERSGGCTGRSPSSASSGRSPGAPRIRVTLNPATDWGARDAGRTSGTNHIRFLTEPQPLRLTTDAPVVPPARGTQLPAGAAAPFLPRPGRALRRQCRARRWRRCCSQTADALARLGARARHPARMAEGGDPRRDHAEALPARGDRRDRRRDDHLDPGGGQFGAQLGLSLLLDPRRLLHGAGAEPARRARRARKLSLLSAEHRRRGEGRPDPAALRGVGRAEAGGGRGGGAGRLSRHGPGPRRQRRLHPGPARRLRPDRPVQRPGLLRRAPAPAGRPGGFRRRSSGSASGPGRCTTSPTRAFGNSAPAPRSTPTAR